MPEQDGIAVVCYYGLDGCWHIWMPQPEPPKEVDEDEQAQ